MYPGHFAGLAAEDHEHRRGNVQAKAMDVPDGGSAAQIHEKSVKAAPERRVPFSGVVQVKTSSAPRVTGLHASVPRSGRDIELEQRKASDYLPADVKALLIARGCLTSDGYPLSVSTTMTPPRVAAEAANKNLACVEPSGVLRSLWSWLFKSRIGNKREAT